MHRVGNVTIGDMSIVVGDSNGQSSELYAFLTADVSGTGDASIGNVTIGNLSSVSGDSGDDVNVTCQW